MLYFSDLEQISSQQLRLHISSLEQNRAWGQSRAYSNKIASYNAYINSICLYTFLNWFAELVVEESLPEPSIYPSEDSLPSIWEILNGGAIEIGGKRIVLIPQESTDLSELSVPQEWVDIPRFASDYYLAVQVNLEGDEQECWMRVCGFTTHRQLKYFGKYNDRERTYELTVEELNKNLTVMLLTQELQLQEEITPFPHLSEINAKQCLDILSDPSLYSPRLQLDIPFPQWAALLENDELRGNLYHRRVNKLQTVKNTIPTNNLSNWLQNIFDAGWQSINTLIGNSPENLAFAFRQREHPVRMSVEGAKVIDLGIQLANKSVVLLVALSPEDERKVSIRVKLHPSSKENYLPENIRLALLTKQGDVLQEFTSRIQDNFIQLKRFICPVGKSFRIQVAMDDLVVTEDFVIEAIPKNI